MGFDISNHAVDTKFIADRLIPGLLSGAPLDDVFDRAARLAVTAHRANQWGLRVVKLDHLIRQRQRDVGPERTVVQPKKVGWLKSLLGARATEEIRMPARTSGLPGFDSDLSVWGRPFFIVADTVDESLAAFEEYRRCADPAAVDALARAMIAKLDASRHRLPAELDSAVRGVLDGFYPLFDHLPEPDAAESRELDLAATRRRIAAQFELYRQGWADRDSDRVLESELLYEPAAARELALSAPGALLNIAAQVLPGWMGRGYVWPTALFDRIGVDVSHVFETPTALFEPLVRQCPAVEERFSTTIEENFSLGGYVRPERVPVLKALLLEHRRELILAWAEQKHATDLELEGLSADFTKILEPVTLAERQGFGFLEAAEVYSGFMGVMN